MPMPHRRLCSLYLAILLPLLACSKTEDVAPEKRIFGAPPVIETVDVDVHPQFGFECDFSEIMETKLCAETQATDIEAFPNILIRGSYTRLFITARVTDPNTTFDTDGNIDRSDLLLVAASYTEVDTQTKPKPETTLVLFDDGSETTGFTRRQRSSTGEDCTIDPNVGCTCQARIYQLTSRDEEKNDSRFTRGFGFVGQGAAPYVEDCIMQSEQLAYSFTPPNNRFEFRIDAVDKSGNLTTWGERPIITTGEDTFTCTGDECGCCLFISSNPCAPPDPEKKWERGGCIYLEGMVSPSSFPNGICIDYLPLKGVCN
jgi:hypothetical protein